MRAREIWFPSMESQSVVGRFTEIEVDDIIESQKRGEHVTKWVPALESKIAGSHDVACQRVKPFNETALQSRFPGAWDYFLKTKATEPAHEEMPAVKGTPLDRLDFIPREKIAWLKMQGFSTAEQIATLGDHQLANLGPEARKWKKKAGQSLAGQVSATSRA